MIAQEQKDYIEELQQPIIFVQQICTLLRLNQTCTKTAVGYFIKLFKAESHQFDIEIMIAATIFLSAKIFEVERKIRDILNIIFVVTKMHKILNHQNQKLKNQNENSKKLLDFADLIEINGVKQQIEPNYTYDNYNQYKDKILAAEQTLLRIIGFDFSDAENNSDKFKSILVIIHQLRLPQQLAQIVLNSYNDLLLTNQEEWIPGIFYFSYKLWEAGNELETENESKELEFEPKQVFVISDQQWEALFCTKISKLKQFSCAFAESYQSNVCIVDE